MNRKSVTVAMVTGFLLGIVVIRPMWKVIHAFDSSHGDTSWFDFIKISFVEVFSFVDLDETLFSILFGVIICILVLMIRAQRIKKTGNPS